MLPPVGKFRSLFTLILLCLLCGGLLTLISMGLSHLILGLPMNEIQNAFDHLDEPGSLRLVKFFQLANTVGLFVLPGLLYLKLFPSQLKLNIKQPGPIVNYGLVVLMFVVFMPFLNYIIALNAEMHLPDFLADIEQWMRASEDNAERLTQAFIKMNSLGDLAFNVLLIGVLPALGEELIFRGIIQRTINKNRRNYHMGIWVSAALFSAIHVQFFGFFPRLFLGAFFGYLLYWSGTLWLPMFAHFLNNTSAILLIYFMGSEQVEEQVDQIGTGDGNAYLPWLSLVLFSYLLFRFKQRQKKPPALEGGVV